MKSRNSLVLKHTAKKKKTLRRNGNLVAIPRGDKGNILTNTQGDCLLTKEPQQQKQLGGFMQQQLKGVRNHTHTHAHAHTHTLVTQLRLVYSKTNQILCDLSAC